MGKEYRLGLMVLNTRGSGKMTKCKVKGLLCTRMKMSMWESLWQIEQTDLVSIQEPMVKCMKDTGLRISPMAKVSKHLITAQFTKGNSVKVAVMVMEFSNSQMDPIIRGTGRITSSMDKVSTTGIMVNVMLENIKTTR